MSTIVTDAAILLMCWIGLFMIDWLLSAKPSSWQESINPLTLKRNYKITILLRINVSKKIMIGSRIRLILTGDPFTLLKEWDCGTVENITTLEYDNQEIT